jgi:hypothetical protein
LITGYRNKQSFVQLPGERSLAAFASHLFVTIRLYVWTVFEDSPYTISSGVVAAIAIAYLLFVLAIIVLFSP